MVYAKVYSICFENIAKYSVDICWKQLGLQQEHLKSDLAKFKKLKLQQRGPKKNKDWRHANNFYKHCNERWAERNMFPIKEGLSYDEPLMNYEQGGNVDEGENVEEPIQANTIPISTFTSPNIEPILSQSSPRDEVRTTSSTSSPAQEAFPTQTPPESTDKEHDQDDNPNHNDWDEDEEHDQEDNPDHNDQDEDDNDKDNYIRGGGVLRTTIRLRNLFTPSPLPKRKRKRRNSRKNN